MKQLANNEKLDPSYFSKLFLKETGITTKQYILNAKIKTSENMLLYSEHTLSDISLALGFSSQGAFTTAFKKQIGMPPGEYRKNVNYKNLFDEDN